MSSFNYGAVGASAKNGLPRYRAHYVGLDVWMVRGWNKERREYVNIEKSAGQSAAEAIGNYEKKLRREK